MLHVRTRRTASIGVSLIASLVLFAGIALAQLPPGGTFIDDDGNVHEANIEAIADAGITRGCNPPANTKYCPGGAVTRGQMAAFMVRALDLTDSGNKDFTDDNDSVFEGDIEKLAAAGITLGCNPPSNTMFCPDDNVTRDQMASFLARALGLAPITPPSREVGDTKNCTDFATWAEAQAWFDLHYPTEGDIAKLDQDGDLIACEGLPGAPE